MTFGAILSRGFSAANRSVAGLLMMFVLYGLYQGASVVIGGAIDPQAFMIQPGQEPPPELLLMMGFGCFSCLWVLVMVFGGPWVTAGIMGQLGDRISRPDEPVGGFATYAGRYYVRILVLTLVFVVIVVVLTIMMGLFNMVISGLQFQPGAIQDIQKLNTNPASIALSAVFVLVIASLGLVFTVANAVIVTDHTDAFTSLGTAFTFLTRHVGDAIKLIAVTWALGMVIWAPNLVRLLLDLRDMFVLASLGAATAVYYPYVLLLGMAWGMSLWLARRPMADEATEGPNAGLRTEAPYRDGA